MVCAYSELVTRIQFWAEKARDSGWITTGQFDDLVQLDNKTPANLFADKAARPLIVAFLGGTGVGKSSLINRLAGKEIARTGVERPTSREVTLYCHQSVTLEKLPEDLPLNKIKRAQHDNDQRKNVLWIDMPDMDSIEQTNKQLVLDWLPHVDVLIYVVSPERYRDNKAWRLLLREGARHAWIFVLNQWDRGSPEQYQDFIRQLKKAGFEQPVIKRTVCDPVLYPRLQDEFEQLQETIYQLGQGNTLQHLEQRNEQLRKRELKQKLQKLRQHFGLDDSYQTLQNQWQTAWQETEPVLNQGFDWPLQCMAKAYVQSAAQMIEKQEPAVSRKNLLWDDWAQSRFEDIMDEIILTADHNNRPVPPLRHAFTQLKASAARILQNQTELAVRRALANPGNGLQQFMLKTGAFCATVLPLSAMTWVGYQIFNGYYDSSVSDRAYLGVDFAVHSILLILISWLIPFFIQKQFKPSMEKVALQGLKKGLQAGLSAIDVEVRSILSENEQQRLEYLGQLDELITECQPDATSKPIAGETLARMLVN